MKYSHCLDGMGGTYPLGLPLQTARQKNRRKDDAAVEWMSGVCSLLTEQVIYYNFIIL